MSLSGSERILYRISRDSLVIWVTCYGLEDRGLIPIRCEIFVSEEWSNRSPPMCFGGPTSWRNMSPFCWIRRSIAVIIKARHWAPSWNSWPQSDPAHPVPLTTLLILSTPHIAMSLEWCFPPDFPCALHHLIIIVLDLIIVIIFDVG